MAYGILQAGSLPRDVNEAPKEPASLIGEIAQYLVLVSAYFYFIALLLAYALSSE